MAPPVLPSQEVQLRANEAYARMGQPIFLNHAISPNFPFGFLTLMLLLQNFKGKATKNWPSATTKSTVYRNVWNRPSLKYDAFEMMKTSVRLCCKRPFIATSVARRMCLLWQQIHMSKLVAGITHLNMPRRNHKPIKHFLETLLCVEYTKLVLYPVSLWLW